LYFVRANGELVTPPTSGTILEGVTRMSILQLATELGLTPVERPLSIDEWRSGVASGDIREVFACGTAAVVTPVGRLVWEGGEIGDSTAGEMTMRIRDSLVGVQYGRKPDTHNWLHRLA
jgi:branched-chain amino acid aminotransferase